MAQGDPRFGHTFVKLRGALIVEVVIEHLPLDAATTEEARARGSWKCKLCGGTWPSDTSRHKAATHAGDCVLSLYRDDEEGL